MDEDDAKRVILARRARFVAAALAGAGATSTLEACSGAHDGDDSGVAADVAPRPCLSGDFGVPQPCLAALPPDAEAGVPEDASVLDDAATPDDTMPEPPQPCLGAPYDPDAS